MIGYDSLPQMSVVKERMFEHLKELGDLVSNIEEVADGYTFWCHEVGSMRKESIQYTFYYSEADCKVYSLANGTVRHWWAVWAYMRVV